MTSYPEDNNVGFDYTQNADGDPMLDMQGDAEGDFDDFGYENANSMQRGGGNCVNQDSELPGFGYAPATTMVATPYTNNGPFGPSDSPRTKAAIERALNGALNGFEDSQSSLAVAAGGAKSSTRGGTKRSYAVISDDDDDDDGEYQERPSRSKRARIGLAARNEVPALPAPVHYPKKCQWQRCQVWLRGNDAVLEHEINCQHKLKPDSKEHCRWCNKKHRNMNRHLIMECPNNPFGIKDQMPKCKICKHNGFVKGMAGDPLVSRWKDRVTPQAAMAVHFKKCRARELEKRRAKGEPVDDVPGSEDESVDEVVDNGRPQDLQQNDGLGSLNDGYNPNQLGNQTLDDYVYHDRGGNQIDGNFTYKDLHGNMRNGEGARIADYSSYAAAGPAAARPHVYADNVPQHGLQRSAYPAFENHGQNSSIDRPWYAEEEHELLYHGSKDWTKGMHRVRLGGNGVKSFWGWQDMEGRYWTDQGTRSRTAWVKPSPTFSEEYNLTFQPGQQFNVGIGIGALGDISSNFFTTAITGGMAAPAEPPTNLTAAQPMVEAAYAELNTVQQANDGATRRSNSKLPSSQTIGDHNEVSSGLKPLPRSSPHSSVTPVNLSDNPTDPSSNQAHTRGAGGPPESQRSRQELLSRATPTPDRSQHSFAQNQAVTKRECEKAYKVMLDNTTYCIRAAGKGKRAKEASRQVLIKKATVFIYHRLTCLVTPADLASAQVICAEIVRRVSTTPGVSTSLDQVLMAAELNLRSIGDLSEMLGFASSDETAHLGDRPQERPESAAQGPQRGEPTARDTAANEVAVAQTADAVVSWPTFSEAVIEQVETSTTAAAKAKAARKDEKRRLDLFAEYKAREQADIAYAENPSPREPNLWEDRRSRQSTPEELIAADEDDDVSQDNEAVDTEGSKQASTAQVNRARESTPYSEFLNLSQTPSPVVNAAGESMGITAHVNADAVPVGVSTATTPAATIGLGIIIISPTARNHPLNAANPSIEHNILCSRCDILHDNRINCAAARQAVIDPSVLRQRSSVVGTTETQREQVDLTSPRREDWTATPTSADGRTLGDEDQESTERGWREESSPIEDVRPSKDEREASSSPAGQASATSTGGKDGAARISPVEEEEEGEVAEEDVEEENHAEEEHEEDFDEEDFGGEESDGDEDDSEYEE